MIILEASRRFIETQRFCAALETSVMSRREVRFGPVLASRSYLFDSSPLTTFQEQWTLTQLRGAPSELEIRTRKPSQDARPASVISVPLASSVIRVVTAGGNEPRPDADEAVVCGRGIMAKRLLSDELIDLAKVNLLR